MNTRPPLSLAGMANVLLVTTVACTQAQDDLQPLVLVKEGRPHATVVVPVSANSWTTLAAGWLQDYVQRATGARLPIATEDTETSGTIISVGHTQLAARARIAQDDWKWDTARMVVRGDVLFLLGRDDPVEDASVPAAHGTCKAAVSFLEDHCGVRWFLPVPDGESEVASEETDSD